MSGVIHTVSCYENSNYINYTTYDGDLEIVEGNMIVELDEDRYVIDTYTLHDSLTALAKVLEGNEYADL